MASDHLRNDDDVEEILKIAIRQTGGAEEQVLRQRLRLSASELGLTEEQIQLAEAEYQRTRDEIEFKRREAQDLREYRAEQRKEFMPHLVAYVIANLSLVLMNLFQSGRLTWAFWSIVGWGIGLAFHAAYSFVPGAIDPDSFEEWRRKREAERRGTAT